MKTKTTTQMPKAPGKSMSAPNGHAVGSGSRPGGGKHAIPTSAPIHHHNLGRKTPGALK